MREPELRMAEGLDRVTERALRREIVEVCRLMHAKNLIAATDGNVSARWGESYLITTPSGLNVLDEAGAPLAVPPNSGPISIAPDGTISIADAIVGRMNVVTFDDRQDLQKAQQRLENELGSAIPYFAYPYGEYNTELAQSVAELGLTGMGQQSGAIGPDSDFSAITVQGRP